MSGYYTGWKARSYNFFWHTYNRRTLLQAQRMIDIDALKAVQERLGRAPCALDVACGTGMLLRWLLEEVPGLEAYGIDASADMLAQASGTLRRWPQVHLEQLNLGPESIASLPYAPGSFDLITFTNALHYMEEPLKILMGLKRLLAPGAQVVIEDYRERELPIISPVFKWLVRRIDPQHVRTYTLAGTKALCIQAGLRVRRQKTFSADWLCHGWALQALADTA